MNNKFSSSAEEIEHWKSEAMKYKESMESAKEELEEYQASSRELEIELESQLESAEVKNKELVTANSRLTIELEGVREKLDKQHSANHKHISELETKLAKVEAYSAALQKYIRELEQANDDLERAKRAAVVSLEDFELRLNQAIERNAFLESELDEKENLAICVQRLKDEARDLRHELAARHQAPGDYVKYSDDQSPTTHNDKNAVQSPAYATIDSHQIDDVAVKTEPLCTPDKMLKVKISPKAVEHGPESMLIDDQSPANTQNAVQSPASSDQPPTTPITTATRISALTIVGDLLRKLGALESKLATCHTVDRSSIMQYRDNTSGTQQTPAGKRLNVADINMVSLPAAVQIPV